MKYKSCKTTPFLLFSLFSPFPSRCLCLCHLNTSLGLSSTTHSPTFLSLSLFASSLHFLFFSPLTSLPPSPSYSLLFLPLPRSSLSSSVPSPPPLPGASAPRRVRSEGPRATRSSRIRTWPSLHWIPGDCYLKIISERG